MAETYKERMADIEVGGLKLEAEEGEIVFKYIQSSQFQLVACLKIP
jgi:hypothetical protein